MTRPHFPVMKWYIVVIVVIIILVVVTTLAIVLVNASDGSMKHQETHIGRKEKKNQPRRTMTEKKKLRNSWEFNLTDIADELLADMNLAVNPCEDFYEFVCGKVKDTHLPIYHPMRGFKGYTRHHITMNNVREELKVIMPENSSAGEIQPLKNVRNFYKACIKTESSSEGNNQTLGLILKKLGSWPLLDSNWNEEIFTWTDCMRIFSEIGYDVFLTAHYDGSNEDGYQYFSLDIAMPLFRLNELAEGLNEPTVSAFLKRMVKLAESIGAVNPERDLRKALAFDKKLYDITRLMGPGFEIFNKLPIRELIKSKYLNISWLDYLSTRTPSHFDLADVALDGLVVVTQTEHQLARQKALEELVKHTPKRVQANYAFLRFLANVTTFSDNLEIRRNDCYNFVSSRLPLATDILYVRNYFKQDFKTHIHQMITDIRNEMKVEAEKVLDVGRGKMREMLSKIDNITVLLGYPDEFFDDKSISKYYDSLVIEDQDFLQGLLNYSTAYRWQPSFQSLPSLDIHKSWQQYKNIQADVTPGSADVNIRIPASFLHGSYFHLQQPQYMNYGALGADIGMLTADVLAKLLVISGGKDDFKYWGIHSAYSAYEKRMTGSNATVELPLPTMEDFSPEKMFWISLVHGKCTKKVEKEFFDLEYFNFYTPVVKSLDFKNDFACNPIN